MRPETQKILAMVEAVTAATPAEVLDEIDARVNCLISNREIHTLPIDGTFSSWALDKDGRRVSNSCSNHTESRWKKFTRSIDAQDALRKEGWRLKVWQNIADHWYADIAKDGVIVGGCDGFLTEPLARLHAWVQVWGMEDKCAAP